LDTRDTVCDDTPASLATSAIEGRGPPAAVLLVRVMAPRAQFRRKQPFRIKPCASMLEQRMFT
jgi:hypothetical protein